MPAKISQYRTEAQSRAVIALQGKGFAHERDSDYRIRRGRMTVGRVALVVLFGWERYAVVYPDGSSETRDRKRGGSKSVTFNRDKLMGETPRPAPLPLPFLTAPSRRGGYREPPVTRGADAPLPESRHDVRARLLARLDREGAFRQDYSNGEFTSSSLVVARTMEDALRVAVLEAPGYTVHFDAVNNVFWRRGGSFD